jgi:hypothetical protein
MFDYAIPKRKYAENGSRIKLCSGHRTFKRRIIHTVNHNGLTYEYHATKGWRITKTGN